MTDFNFETYMLKQIDKISENFEIMRDDLSEVKHTVSSVMTKIDQYSPEDLPLLKQKFESLEGRYVDLEKRMRDTEVQANVLKGKWAILAILGGAVLSLSLTALGFVLFKDDPPPPPAQGQIMHQPAIPAKDSKYEGLGSYPPR